tara:strand:+ start:223 stop:417 length:195 start_codon:yes stop_codon:yes gene_type:complete
MITFQQYLTKHGDSLSSEKLSIKPRRVAAYRRGERMPRPKDIPRFILLAEGELSLQSFFPDDEK